MEQLIQQLINRLVALESEFDSLPDLSIIQSMMKEIEALKQNETLLTNEKTLVSRSFEFKGW